MKPLKILLLFVAVLAAAILGGIQFGGDHGALAGIAIGVVLAEMMVGAWLRSYRGQLLGDNVVAAGLNLDVILDSALTAFGKGLLAIIAFSTVFRNVQLKGTNKIAVPYYPIETATSRDYDGTYKFGDTDTELVDVTVNKRKYQSMAFSSAELARTPALNPEKLGELKGRKLAEDVVTDILSIVTNANFGAAIFTGAASTFDLDDVADMRTVLDVANWPKSGRNLILDTNYDGALVKDDPLLYASLSGTSDQMRSGLVKPMMGFDGYYPTNMIPANGENLKGLCAYASAILAAFSPIEPTAEVRKNMSDYRIVTDPETGISLEYRSWGDPDSDVTKAVIECNYGYDLGETAAIKRIVSA